MSYRLLFHLVLRRLPAEGAHRAAFAAIRAAGAIPGVRLAVRRALGTRDERLAVRAFGVDFPAPLGLAAGFDKDARGVDALAGLGFGYVEVGTITAQPQPGNPEPRLFRLTRDRALINRMGFNNAGAAAVGVRLERRRRKSKSTARRPRVVTGVNIGRTKVVSEDDAIADYVTSARTLAPYADYLVVNVSSPNTPGLRDLQAVRRLRPLLEAVRSAVEVPVLVKIAPDLADGDIDAVADLALELGLAGIVATNTTIGRSGLASDPGEVEAYGPGGLSGAPLADRALAVLRQLRARVGDRLVLVAVGGIETPDDAWERIRAGATLLQAYTGFVYGGPFWPRRIQRGLARRLEQEGYARLSDAIGSAALEPADPLPTTHGNDEAG